MQFMDKTPSNQHLQQRLLKLLRYQNLPSNLKEIEMKLSSISEGTVRCSYSPVLFKKVMCPSNLGFDSETSNGAEWSLSMVTPTTRLTVRESPPSFTTTTTTEEDEEREEYPTTDESVLELRNVLNTGASSKNQRRLSLKVHMKAQRSGRSVVRTLFPARSSGISNVMKSSDASPLARHIQACGNNSSVSNIRKKESNVRKEAAVIHLQQSTSCSQELFGFPACVVPTSPQTSPTAEEETVSFVGKTPRIPHNGYLLVHSTPLCADQSRSGKAFHSICDNCDKKPDKLDNLASPKASGVTGNAVHLMPSCLSATPEAALSCSSVVAETPCRNADISSRPESFSFTGGDDVLDVLFMSSSQLESHFNLQDSHQHSAEDVGTTSTEIEPSDEIHACPMTLDRLPKAKEKYDIMSAGGKKQVDRILYPNLKRLSHRRSRIKTRVSVCVKKPSCSRNAVMGSSSPICITKRPIDEDGNFRTGLVSDEPLAKKQCSDTEGEMYEEFVQKSSDEEGCEVEADCCGDGSSVKQGYCEGKNVPEETKERANGYEEEMELAEEENGDQGVVTGLDHLRERDGRVSTIVSEVSASVTRECQSCINESDDVKKCPEGCITNEELDKHPKLSEPDKRPKLSAPDKHPKLSEPDKRPKLSAPDKRPKLSEPDKRPKLSEPDKWPKLSAPDKRPKLSAPGAIGKLKSEHAQQVDLASLGRDASSKTEAKVSLDTAPLSPIPVLKMRHVRVPGLSRSAQKQLGKNASVQFPTRGDQVGEDLSFVPTPASCVSERGGFVEFMTAAGGSSIPISTAALDKAKKLVDTGFEDNLTLEEGAHKGCVNISHPSFKMKADALQGDVVSLKESASFGPKVNPKYRTPNSSFTFSRTTSVRNCPGGSATYPRLKGPPTKRQGTKGFRAPRLASDVSKEEERVSLSRILKNFGVPTTNVSPTRTGSVDKPTVSHRAVLKARELFSEDSEGAIHVETNKNAAWKGRKCAPIPNDSMTSFQTASGKGVLISSKSLERALELVAEGSRKECGSIQSRMNVAEQSTSESSACMATGFKTAGGKGLSVSCNALKKAQEMIAEESQKASGLELPMERGCAKMEALESSSCTATGFKTAGGKKVSVSSNALKKAQGMFAEESQEVSGVEFPLERGCSKMGTLQSSSCAATGFKTAGGKGILVSSNALKKAQGMFAEESKEVSGVEFPLERGCAKMGTLQSSSCTATGFKTAGGKGILVSSNALKKAQGMFAEESKEVSGVEFPLERGCSKMGTLQSSSCTATGFKTAGGKEILISSDALKKAQEMIADDSQMAFGLEAQMELESMETTATSEPSAYAATMFKTAAGSAMAVSLESLRRVEMAGKAETEECVVLSEPRQDILEHCSPCKHVTRDMNVSVDAKIVSKNPAIGDETNTACGNEDSSSCYFSTQVVRQLLNFSSEEESLAEDSILNNSDQPCEKTSSHLRKVETMEDAAHDYMESNFPSVSPSRQQHENEGCDLSESVVGHMETSSMSSWLPLEDSICPKVVSSFCESINVPVPTMASSCVTPSHLNGMAELADGCSPTPTTCLSISAPVDEEEGYCQSQNLNPVPLPAGFTTIGKGRVDIPSTALHDVTSSFLSLASPLHKVIEWSSEGALVSVVELPSVLYQDHESDEDKDKHSQVCGGDIETRSASLTYPGLQTANGKKGEVSKEAIEEVKATLGCITSTFDSLQRQQPFTDLMANEASKLKRHESLGVDEAVLGATDLGTRCFQAATGKVDMSGKSVRATSKLFLGEPGGKQLSPMGSFHTTSGTKVEDSVRAAIDESCDKEFLSFCGFQTAGGKKVEISEESIRAAKTALGEPNDDRVSSFCGFQTAGGKKVEISEESIRAAKIALGEPNDDRVSSFCGFQTAGGKKVEISEESIRAAKTALGEPNDDRVSSFCGFQTAGGKKVEISEESIRAAKTALGEPNDDRVSSFCGFQTAGGKKVEISEESIRAAKIALGEPNNERVSSFCGFQTAGGKKVEISEESIRAAKIALGEPNDDRGSSFCGFQTAGGKKVEISEESIRAAKIALGEPNYDRGSSFCGFQTAGGKKVEISEESIRAAKIALGEPNDDRGSSFCGFQTAGGKVEISEESIRAAKTALGEPNDDRVSSFCGFQTAGGKKVEISEESIRAAKANSDPRQCSNLFPSLQTASGKHVNISKQSLQAVRVALGESGSSPNVQRTAKSCGIVRSKKLNTDKTCKSAVGETSGSMAFSGLRISEVDVSCRSLELARSVHASACASSVYCTTERSSHLSRLCDNEQMAPLLRGSLTSIPEATLCDRTLPGRGSLQAQLSLPPGNIHSSTPHPSLPSLPSLPSNKNTSGCPTLYNQNVQLFNIPQQNSPLSSTQLQSQAGTFNHHRTSSHHSPFQTVPFMTKSLPLSCSSLSPTFVSVYTSSPHSRPCQSVQQHDDCSYTAPSKTNFNIPMKGKSMNSYTRPAVWNTPVSHRQHRTSQPLWRGSTLTATGRAESSIQHEKSEAALSGDSGSLCHHLHITLSQVFDMEDSQNKGDFDSRLLKEASSVVGGRLVDDSGYVSCEVSTLKSPSPCQEELLLPSEPTFTLRSTEDLTDTLFAEVAMEDIEDTLESCSCDGGLTSPTSNPTSITSTPISATSTSSTTSSTPTSITSIHTSTTSNHTSITSNPTSTTSTPTSIPTSTTSTTSTLTSTPTSSPTYSHTSTTTSTTSTTSNPTSTTSTPTSIPTSTTSTTSNPTSTTSTPTSTTFTISTPLGNQEVKEATSSRGAFRSADMAPSTKNTRANSDKHVIKPQHGSLLELRLEHRSSRVALRNAVCCKLPRRRSSRELSALGVPDYAQDLTSDNAKDFRFPVECFSSSAVRNGCSVCVGDGALLALTCGSAGVDEFWDAFRTSPGVDLKLISFKWFVNHFKHLTIKLASMERMYPRFFAGRCLNPDWLMFQLKYCYDRGIDGAERSAVHRICEHDDLPSRRMVLYVSKICSCSSTPPGDESSLAAAELSCNGHQDETRVETKLDPPSLVLSDGWYDLPCVLDRPLRYMLGTGKIRVGTKLVVYGAELLGLKSPCHPLEVPVTCCLKISANSTRRALWHARLGFQPCSLPFPLPLECLFADGGLVGSVSAVIARVYPMVYLEKKEGSKNVMRCVRVEEKVAAHCAREREKVVEDVCSRVRKEFENEVAQQDFPPCKRRRSRRLNTIQVKQLWDGKDIYDALMNAPDPQAIQELLSDMQRVYLESYQLSVETERQNELQCRMKMAIQEAEETIPPQREVIPLLRLRLVPTTLTTGSVAGCNNDLDCQLSIWRPHDHLQQIKEGTIMKISNVTANPAKYHTSRLQLASSRSTRYETLSSGPPPGQVHYLPRRILSISELGSLSASQVPYREFDTVGLVAHLSTTSCPPRHPDDSGCAVDRICLVDLSGILLVKVWGGVKSFGLEGVVSLGAVLCFSNLCHRGGGSPGSSNGHHTAPPWPTAHLTDITVVSQNPKETKCRTALARFKQQLPANNNHKALFLEKWAEEIRTYL